MSYEKEIISAVQANQPEEVERLIKLGANVDAMVEQDGKIDITYPAPILLYAIKASYEELINILLEHGADVNKPSASGLCPLLAATENSALIKKLLSKGANVQQRHNSGYTALYNASADGNVKSIELLIKAGGDIDDDQNVDTSTPLQIASQEGRIDAVKTLLRHKASVDKGKAKFKWSPLQIASQNGHLAIVQLLIEAGAEVDHQNNDKETALTIACKKGHTAIVAYLLSKGADVNHIIDEETTDSRRCQLTCLMLASEQGHAQVAGELLRAGADINAQSKGGLTALYYAACNKKTEVVARLIQEKSLDPNLTSEDTRWMWTPLNAAAEEGYVEIVKILLTHPAIDVNKDDYYHNVPLINAVKKGHIEIAKLLLGVKDINVDASEMQGGKTALEYAEEKGFEELEKMLKRMSSKTSTSNPLISATRKGDRDKVRELLQHDTVDVNSETDNGETALFIACDNNNLAIVKSLLTKPDIQINKSNKAGITPLGIAAAKGFADIVAELGKHQEELHLDPNLGAFAYGGATPLYNAASNGHVGAIKELFKLKGINVNQSRTHEGNDGTAPLTTAAKGNHIEALRLLAAHPDIDVNIRTAAWQGSKTALINAVINGNAEMVKILLAHPKIKVNLQTTTGGYTALALAAADGHTNCISLLLESDDIDVNLQSKRGETPIYCAAATGHTDAVVILLQAKNIKVNQPNNNGVTPLIVAIDDKKEYSKIVELLINAPGINIDQAGGRDYSDEGITPLMMAAIRGHMNITKLLIEKGANVLATAKTKAGDLYTARLFAIRYGHLPLATYLKDIEDQQNQKKVEAEQKALQANIQEKKQEEQKIQRKLERTQSQAVITQQQKDDQTRELNELKQTLAQLQGQIAPLTAAYQQKQELLQKQAYLRSKPLLKAFYNHFQLKMTEIILAYKVVDSGIIDRSADKTENILDKVSQGIDLLGGFVSLPGASLVTSAINAGISLGKYYHGKKEEKKFALVAKLLISLSAMEEEVETAARELAYQYEPQIAELAADGAFTLAECAVRRLLEFMRADLANEEDALSIQLIKAIATFDSNQGTLPFTHKAIETGQKKTPAWTDKGIFQESGIETEDGKKFVGKSCQPAIYGYRRATFQLAVDLGYTLVAMDINALLAAAAPASSKDAASNPASATGNNATPTMQPNDNLVTENKILKDQLVAMQSQMEQQMKLQQQQFELMQKQMQQVLTNQTPAAQQYQQARKQSSVMAVEAQETQASSKKCCTLV